MFRGTTLVDFSLSVAYSVRGNRVYMIVHSGAPLSVRIDSDWEVTIAQHPIVSALRDASTNYASRPGGQLGHHRLVSSN